MTIFGLVLDSTTDSLTAIMIHMLPTIMDTIHLLMDVTLPTMIIIPLITVDTLHTTAEILTLEEAMFPDRQTVCLGLTPTMAVAPCTMMTQTGGILDTTQVARRIIHRMEVAMAIPVVLMIVLAAVDTVALALTPTPTAQQTA